MNLDTWYKNLDELNKKYPSKEFGVVHVYRDYDCFSLEVDKGWKLELPHSCDEWVIGTVGEAKEFAKSLNEAIKYCEDNP